MWRGAGRRGSTWLLAVSLVAGACATSTTTKAPLPTGAIKPDDLMVVDCLLPGQIRQLGGQTTYVSRPRAIKTAARDCAIRGGEYVAFDRANYATALKVWLPLAEQGDLNAQTYVGEIFEKGLGLPPDYQAAAQWYRKAAERGYSRAALNLGSLYERGLGVPKDPSQALNWYRRASGLSELTFDLSAPAAGNDVQALRTEVQQLRQELDAKTAAVSRLEQELDTARRTLEGRRSQADTERDTIARLRRELEQAQQRDSAGTARVQQLERSVAERQQQVAQRERELSELRASASGDVAAAQKQAELGRAQLETLRTQLAESQRDATARRTRAQELERLVADSETRAAAKDREVGELRTTVARLETERREQRERLERLRQQTTTTAGAGPSISLIEPELRLTRDASASARAEIAGDRAVVVGRVVSEIELASLTVNGRSETLRNNVFRSDVPVRSAEQPVRIVAVDRDGQRSVLEFRLVRAAEPAPTARRETAEGEPRLGLPRPSNAAFGAYHALVIGNNDYQQLPRLKTAVNDATEVASVLEREYGFRVRRLTNATRYDILSALNELREQLTEKDNLLIYYAGHGELDERNQRGHWLPVDAEPNSSANWISNIAVTDILNAMNVQQLVVVADSCYAGTLTRSSLGRLPTGLSDAERLKLMQTMAQKRSRMAMTSGGKEPVIDSDGRSQHSAFEQIFVTLLRANVGVVSGQELFNQLRLRVAAVAQQVQMNQVPEYAPIKYAGHESGDFFFVRTASN
jgi:Caspase domain/Sel1 repeat